MSDWKYPIQVKCPYCGQEQTFFETPTFGRARPRVVLCDVENVPGCDRYFVVQVTFDTTVVAWPIGEKAKGRNCGNCHTCGQPLRIVLDGEEWCDTCGTYRRYKSHGWSMEEDSPCSKGWWVT